jgi:hypothetical protein
MIDFDARKSDLDQALDGVGPNTGIKFGLDLFAGFAKRGWITKETFSAWGTGAYPEEVPAYARTHYAMADWDLPLDGFKVAPHA